MMSLFSIIVGAVSIAIAGGMTYFEIKVCPTKWCPGWICVVGIYVVGVALIALGVFLPIGK